MITKAIIRALPQNKNNKYLVEIPIFISAGMNKDSDLCAGLMEATLCYQPGIIHSFNIGDVVFISFEDNQMQKPIILGKLYLNGDNDNKVGYAQFESLRADKGVILPRNTLIGEVSGANLEQFANRIANLESSSSSCDIPQELLRNITGYDGSKTQTLKNVNGTFTWVDDN